MTIKELRQPSSPNKKQFGISSKREIFDWKKRGNAKTNLTNFPDYYQRVSKATKTASLTGKVALSLNAAVTTANIIAACDDTSSRGCHRTTVTETTGFAAGLGGAVLGGKISGSVGYGLCALVFSPVSAGTSLLWCGLVAGTVGGVAGGYALSAGAEKFTGVLFDNVYPIGGL